MEPKLIVAVVCILFALAFYTTGVFAERKAKTLKKWHALVFWIGLAFDMLGTSLMGALSGTSGKRGAMLHGATGFVAIALMVFHALWATIVLKKGDAEKLAAFHKFSLFVWLVWLVSFFTGMFMGMAG